MCFHTVSLVLHSCVTRVGELTLSPRICGSHARIDTVSNIVNLDTNMTLGLMQGRYSTSPVFAMAGVQFFLPGDFVTIIGVGREGGCFWHPVDKDQDCCKHPSMFRTTPLAKNYPAPNVKGAKTEKPWSWILLAGFQNMPLFAIPPLHIGGNVKKWKPRVDIDHGPKALQLEYFKYSCKFYKNRKSYNLFAKALPRPWKGPCNWGILKRLLYQLQDKSCLPCLPTQRWMAESWV